LDYLATALTTILGIVDWVYVLVTILTAYTAVRILGDTNVAKNVNVKVKNRWVVLATAAILAIIFGIFYKVNGGFVWFKPDVMCYGCAVFFSFLISMFLNEFVGISYWLDKLFKVKFNPIDETKPEQQTVETPAPEVK
jgi:hypothetical protein